MAATAPVCNVTVTVPSPRPGEQKGFRTLSPNATLQDVINVINHNANPNTVRQVFNDLLNDAMNNGAFPRASYQTRPSQKSSGNLGDEIDRRIGRLRFIEDNIRRVTIKVENPDDEEDYVYDDRVRLLNMTDQRTGARWTFVDKKARD